MPLRLHVRISHRVNTQVPRDRLPRWFQTTLILTGAGAVWLVGRLTWEQTVLSWRHGPQMVGFSLVHAELGLFLMLLLSSILFALGLLAVAAVTAVAWSQKRQIPALRWVGLATGVCVIGMGFIPYATWQRIFAARLVAGPHASEFFTYAAATGDLATVEAFLQHGIRVNVKDKNGSTALHAASVEGQLRILEVLISHGADPNIRNDSGQTALDNAREMRRDAAAGYLLEHGAR